MKRILAIILSIAILVMAMPISVFATTPESTATDTWDGSTVEPTTTDADGNIIINTAEEMAWLALVGGDTTVGKTYKVADGIDSFNMNGFVGITADSTATDVKSATTTGSEFEWYNDNPVFKGNFDGNGVTIYNIAGKKAVAYGGLFPTVKCDKGTNSTIENVTVKASAFYGYHHAAGIAGCTDGVFTLGLNKCAVENCYLAYYSNDGGGQKIAASMVGKSGNVTINISNCLTVNNIIESAASDYSLNIKGGFIGSSSTYAPSAFNITNSISIGTSPYPTVVESGTIGDDIVEATWTNVYTDEECDVNGITTLTAAQMQGDAAKANMALAWNIDWLAGEEGEYPSINYGEPIKDPYVWDGTFEEPTETDDEGNVIINTVQEMAWVALRGDTATEGKSYKVADSIEYFDMNGSVGVNADSTASEVKDATATGNNWNYAAEGKVGKFMGNFDGNGVTIYNIRTVKHGYAGLFPYVYNESTIQNVTVKASYFAGYHYAAGIVGTSELQKTVNISKCAVVNCYLTDAGDTNTACKRAAAGFVGGTGNSNINILNCLSANNEYSAAGYEAGFVAVSGDWMPTGVSITNSICIGMTPYSNSKLGDAFGKGLTEKLTVENVYSDVACDVAGFTTLTTEQMQGAAAKDNMALSWNIDWLAGEEGAYPSINYGEPIKDPYVWDGTFDEPTETDDEGNIIINTVQELAWVALASGTSTAGKNYKVAANSVFNLNGMDGITLNSTAEQVKTAGDARTSDPYNYTNAWRAVIASSETENAFQGNFDGNGLIVYNLYSAKGRGYGGLFPYAKPATADTPQVIKNVAVYASHIGGYHYAGGIVGLAECNTTSSIVNFDSCVVKNCYIYDNNDTTEIPNKTAGAIVGGMSHNGSTVNNCAAIDNQLSAQGVTGGLIGNKSEYGGSITITNSLSIGTSIKPTAGTKTVSAKFDSAIYTNVYTDQETTLTGVTVLENSKMQGSVATVTMDTLDSSVWFFNTTTYPDLYVFHNVVDGKCDCGLEVAGDPCVGGHTLVAVEGYDATNFTDGLLAHDKCSICDKTFIDGVEKSAEELIIPMLAKKWNGTFVEPTETDANGNIVINTPEELAWVALRGGAATEGKNYIVAKDSVFNLNGMEGITPFSTTSDVKAATKNDTCKWQFATDYTTDSPFSGNFDGNGLIVYNLYTGKGRGFGGLFPVLYNQDGGSITIKNVTLLSSHIGAYHWAGGIVGYANSANSNAKLTIENTAVENCFIYDNDDTNVNCQRTTGVLVGHLLHTATTINNCLVVDNELSAQGIIGGLFGNTSQYGGANTVKNVISVGTSVQATMVNYAINAKTVTYTNVYTDQLASADGITSLTTEQMQGAAAADNMNLNWGINWAVGAEGEYPSIIIDNDFYDEWDGTFVEPTTTDAEGNIIISTAEEMAWVALRGDTATTGKNYKVADGIKYFNMNGMAGITLDSTVTDVKNATKDASKAWNYAADGKTGTFYGNFDGNGVTVYNIYTKLGQGYGGLFPVVKPASGESLTIKNVAVVASYIGGYHCAGGIIGLADAPDTSTKLSLENIIVKNSFMYDNDDANTACQRTAGVLVGNLTHNAATINNIYVSGNELSAQGILGGLFGNTSIYGAASTVSNVISIGTAIEPASVGNTVSEKAANTVYTNVYTDQESTVETVTTLTVDEMSGANAIANTTLDWSGWFATTSLPELRAFHDVTSIDNGDGTHSDLCSECGLGGMNTPHVYENGSCVLCNAECVHVEGEAVEENRVEATCMAEGSYDLVVYCSVCGEEISRTTQTIDIDSDAHTFDSDSDADCNNGCGFIRVNYGDCNGDDEINNKDLVILIRYINGWDVEINELSADVNSDGIINNKDYVLIVRDVNGWND